MNQFIIPLSIVALSILFYLYPGSPYELVGYLGSSILAIKRVAKAIVEIRNILSEETK